MVYSTQESSQPIHFGHFSSLVMRFLTHTEDLYEVTRFFMGFRKVSVSSVKVFTPQMALVVDTTCLHSFPSFHCIGAHALGFVGYVCSTNFFLLFYRTGSDLSGVKAAMM
jgi:hypothetical protein